MGMRIKNLEPPDSLHLSAAEGWLGLGNQVEAFEELEKITRWIQVASATNRKRLLARHFRSDASPFFL